MLDVSWGSAMGRCCFLCALLWVGSFGCTDASEEEIACIEQLNGVCVGVENEAGDKVGACPCSVAPIEVGSQAELVAALAGPPSCIHLAEGRYGVVELRNGFEIVGTSWHGVVLDWLSFVDGSASACRLTTTGANVAEGARGAMQYVSIESSPADGVLVSAGAEARIVGSTIKKSAHYGVSAFGIRSLEIERSVIEGVGTDRSGPGIWASCPEGCSCATPPDVVVSDTVVRKTSIVGIAILGARGDLRNVRVANTTVGEQLDGGLGFGVADCASVTATGLEVVDNACVGMCLDSSKVALDDLVASGNLRAIYAGTRSAPAEVRISGATLTNNRGYGLSIAGATFAVVEDTLVDDTTGLALPVIVSGVSASTENVAEGICWTGSAVAHFHRVTVQGSERNAILIQGPASGILEDVAVPGGHIVQVQYDGGAQPMTSGVTPSIEVSPEVQSCGQDYYAPTEAPPEP